MTQNNQALFICPKCNTHELYVLKEGQNDFCSVCNSNRVGYYPISYQKAKKILEILISSMDDYLRDRIQQKYDRPLLLVGLIQIGLHSSRGQRKIPSRSLPLKKSLIIKQLKIN